MKQIATTLGILTAMAIGIGLMYGVMVLFARPVISDWPQYKTAIKFGCFMIAFILEFIYILTFMSNDKE